MPFKLVVQSPRDKSRGEPCERSFDQDKVMIGRGRTSDLLLGDPQLVVSSRHAEIRQTAHHFVLVDMGSTNGTIINGKRLDAGNEHPLHQGYQIRIGDFLLQFYPVHQPEPQQPIAADLRQMATYSFDRADMYEEVVQQLRRLYGGLRQRETQERETLMVEALREAVRRLDAVQAERLLEYVEAAFPESEYQQQRVSRGSLRASTAPSSDESCAAQAAYDGLVTLARKYFKDLDTPVSSEFVKRVIRQMDRVLEVTFNSLADAVRGRRQFAREFEVEATRILSWAPNPIKLADSGHEIGEYLLDVRKREANLEAAVSDLEGVFRDLALHQVGLIAGFRECLQGLLNQLNPASFESEARAEALKLGPMKVPFRLSPFARRVAWNRYKQKYQKLTEEEVKVFETILAPHFSKGYLSVQKKKKKAHS